MLRIKLSDIKVGKRIAAGFVAVLTLLTIVAAKSYLGFTGIQHATNRSNEIVANTVKALAVDHNFVELRRDVQLYIQNPSDATLKHVQALGTTIKTELAGVIAATADSERRRLLQQIEGLFDKYLANFDLIAKGTAARNRAINEVMNPVGARAHDRLGEIVAGEMADRNLQAAAVGGQALDEVMQTRLYAYRYLVNASTQAISGMEKNHADSVSALERLAGLVRDPRRSAALDELIKIWPDYLAAFRTVVKETTDRNRLINEVNANLAEDINANLIALKSSQLSAVAEMRELAEENITSSIAIGIIGSAIALVVGLLLAWLIGRSITRPVASLTQTMDALARGDLEVVVPAQDRRDEIGQMAKAVQVFKDAGIEKVRLEAAAASQQKATEIERQRNEAARAAAAAEVKHVVDAIGEGLDQLASGALTYRITTEFADEYKKVRTDFNSAMDQLQETVGAIVASVREVSNASGEISTSTTDLSQRTEEQAASLEETSASMEEISATVKKNAENAQQANQFAAGSRDVADRSGAVVAEAVKAMSRIEEASRKISDIIGVIDEIARQTNLLALNAAVEAARAGEAGRGFAVVASEVRSLAQRSSQAAKDIKDLITNSSEEVQEGVELVNSAGTSLAEILTSIKKVADIVSDIAAASAEQSAGIEQVGKALMQMDEVTQQNSALVEENAATAKTLEQQARAMKERVAFFRIDDTGSSEPQSGPRKGLKVPPSAAVHQASIPKRPALVSSIRTSGKARSNAALALPLPDDAEWKDF